MAILFFYIVVFSDGNYSHAFIPVDLKSENDDKYSLIFDSGIIDIDSNFFIENDFKGYLIFGNGLQKNDFLKTNSIYGIQSNNGFFSVALLSDTSTSNLVS